MRKPFPRALAVVALVALPLTGCDGAMVLAPGGGLSPIGTTGSSFAITATNVDPSTVNVTAGQSLSLSVTTSRTADRFSWSATGGQLSSTSGSSVTWTAPSAAGTYRVDVTAYAGAESAPASFRFTVK